MGEIRYYYDGAPTCEPTLAHSNPEWAEREVSAYLNQLKRVLASKGLDLASFPMFSMVVAEVGPFREVMGILTYASANAPDSVQEANYRLYHLEADWKPEVWDEAAKEELGKAYFDALRHNPKTSVGALSNLLDAYLTD